MSIFVEHRKALFWAIAAGLYLRFMLIPTGVVFYELYHATGIDFIYWGYSVFKTAGYYFGVWQYQTLTCVLVALAIFGLAVFRGKRTGNQGSST